MLLIAFSSPSQLYLVLDVTNLTSEEMEFEYTPNKHILIESKESCRVPVPLDRCPFNATPAKTQDDGKCFVYLPEVSEVVGLISVGSRVGTFSLFIHKSQDFLFGTIILR